MEFWLYFRLLLSCPLYEIILPFFHGLLLDPTFYSMNMISFLILLDMYHIFCLHLIALKILYFCASQPRILMAMARDGLLPSFFSEVNKRTQVPVKSTILTGVIAATLSFFMDVEQLAGMVCLSSPRSSI